MHQLFENQLKGGIPGLLWSYLCTKKWICLRNFNNFIIMTIMTFIFQVLMKSNVYYYDTARK